MLKGFGAISRKAKSFVEAKGELVVVIVAVVVVVFVVVIVIFAIVVVLVITVVDVQSHKSKTKNIFFFIFTETKQEKIHHTYLSEKVRERKNGAAMNKKSNYHSWSVA